jgi:adenylate kinase
LSPLLLYIGDKSPTLTNSGIESCAVMLLIKSSKNYRGIVVLPIICKLLEHIARTNFRTILTEKQSPLQRGFTTNISPLNAAIIIDLASSNAM